MSARIGRRTVLAGSLAALMTSRSSFAQSTYAGRYFPVKEFLALPKTYANVTGGTLAIGFAPGKLRLPRGTITDWIEHCAEDVAGYLGSFPGRGAAILVVPVSGSGVQRGTAYPLDPGAVRIIVGERATQADLVGDWRLVHEFMHLALPNVPNQFNWMHEGLATYAEPIVRTRGGRLSRRDVWSTFVRMMPRGLPMRGDRGLDHTPTWGRIYWGGALFFLLADIEIRQRSGNRKGLVDALRAIGAKGGTFAVNWPPKRIFQVGDEGAGSQVFRDLHRVHGNSAVRVNLNALWDRLGVVRGAGNNVSFNEKAPLASIRRSITGL